MEEFLLRIWENAGDRVSGPMWLRLVLQPAVASVFALRAAFCDAREGRPAYFWTVVTQKDQRRDLIREAWSSIAKIFVMAMIMDVIYQLVVQRWVYPVEVVVVAFILAVVPYILIRGPVTRLLSRFVLKK